jgi:exoribonuclease R
VENLSKHDTDEKRLRALLASPESRPMRSRDMAHLLDIPRKEFHDFRGVLEELRQNDEVIRGRDARWRPAARETEVVGKVDIALAGHAFVIPDNPDDPDVFIPPDSLLDAFDGDTVRAMVTESERRGERRLSGRVVEVIRRARSRIVGKMLRNRRAMVEDPRNNYEFSIEFSPDAPAKSASQTAKSQRRRRNAEKAGQPATASSVRLTVTGDAELPPLGQKVLMEVLPVALVKKGYLAS